MSKLKRKWWIALTAVAIAIVLAIAFWPGEKEPEYHGKKLSEWLELVDIGTFSQEATHAVSEIGTNALPFLLKWISYDSSRADTMRSKLPRWMRSNGFVRAVLGDRSWRAARNAVSGFAVLGERASPTIPDLLRMLKQPCPNSKAYNVAQALSKVGKTALAPMLEILADQRAPTESRFQLAGAMMMSIDELRSDLAPAVPVLAQCAQETNVMLAVVSIQGLRHICKEPSISVPALARAAQSSDIRVRRGALLSLAEFGTNAMSALPTITKALKDSDYGTRKAATYALEKIAPEVLRTNAVSVDHE